MSDPGEARARLIAASMDANDDGFVPHDVAERDAARSLKAFLAHPDDLLVLLVASGAVEVHGYWSPDFSTIYTQFHRTVARDETPRLAPAVSSDTVRNAGDA